MTDTSKQFIAMADCPQIQDYYFNNRDFYELLPSFLYRKDMERTVIEIWTPSKLRKQLNMKLDILNINIEYKSELGEITKEGGGILQKNISIWLPTQSQLQGMLSHSLRANIKLFSMFCFTDYLNQLSKQNTGTALAYFDSMEQLWLAFCMAELHQKQWDGTQWIK